MTKYKLSTDFGCLKKGTIIDEKDKIDFTILTDKNFYEANPKQFIKIGNDYCEIGMSSCSCGWQGEYPVSGCPNCNHSFVE